MIAAIASAAEWAGFMLGLVAAGLVLLAFAVIVFAVRKGHC